jgi:hypothetical protein
VPGPVSGFLPGPGFAPGSTFTLSKFVTVTEEFTDNFNLFEEQQDPFFSGVISNRKVSNFRTTVTPGLTLAIDAARTKGFISVGLSLVYDTADDGLKGSLWPNLNMVLAYEINPRMTLTLTDTFTRDDDSFQGDAFGVRRQRAVFTANTFTATLAWQIDRIQTQIYYQNSVFFSEDTPVVQNNATGSLDNTTTVSNIIGANATIPLGSPLTTGTFGYEFSAINSTDVSSSTDEGQTFGNLLYAQVNRRVSQFATVGLSGSYQTFTGQQADIWNISLNAAYGLPGGLSVSGSVGYSYLTGGPGVDAQGTVSTQTQANYVFPRGAIVSVGMFSDFRQSSLTGQDFGLVLTRSYFGSFSYPLTPVMTASAYLSYSENEFTGSGNMRSNQPLNTFTASANLTYQFLSWLYARAGYNYTRYTGGRTAILEGTGVIDLSGGPITENRAYISLTASF